MQRLKLLVTIVLVLGVSACAGVPTSSPADGSAGSASVDPREQAEAEARSGSAAAVQELVASSRTYRSDGDYSHALADIERAIRIEPRNPYIWLELGETHLLRGDSRLAVAAARKALSVAGMDGAAKAAAEDLLRRAARQ